jgi:hypothetical protein
MKLKIALVYVVIAFSVLAVVGCKTKPSTQAVPDAGIASPRPLTGLGPALVAPATPKLSATPVDTRTPAQRLADAKKYASAACRGSNGSWHCADPSNKNGQIAAPLMASGNATAAQCGPACTVPTWYIDVNNTSGCASDSNSCTSAGCAGAGIGPCLSLGQIVERTGSSTPIYPKGQSVTIDFVSAPAGSYGPYYFAPQLSGGGVLSFVNGVSTSIYYGLAQVQGVNVVAAFGVDNTGATDCSAKLQVAITALAATGQAVFLPNGTYLISNTIILPNGASIIAEGPGVTINGNIAGASASNSIFYAAVPAHVGAATTLASTPTAGSQTIAVSAIVGITNGGYIEIVSAASTIFAYYHVDGVSGTTITVDRPLVWPWASGDTVQAVANPPPSVHADFNGATIEGTYVIAWANAYWNSTLSNVQFVPTGYGAHIDALAGWLTGSYGSVMRNLYADMTGVGSTFNAGYGVIGAENCGIENGNILNGGANATGLKEDDCRGCWVNWSKSSNNGFGLEMGTDFGVTTNSVTNSRAVGNTIDGNVVNIVLIGGASNNTLIGNSANYNTNAFDASVQIYANSFANTFDGQEVIGNQGFGINVQSGAKGTTFTGCGVGSNGNYDLYMQDEFSWYGGYISSTTNVSVYYMPGAATDRAAMDGVHITSTTPSAATGVIDLLGGQFTIGGGSTIEMGKAGDIGIWLQIGTPSLNAQAVVIRPIGGAGSTDGIYTNSGNAVLGLGFDSTAAATPLLTGSGTVSLSQGQGIYTDATTTGTVTLTMVQAQANTMKFSQTLTGNTTYNLPAGLGGLLYNVDASGVTLSGHTFSVGVTGGSSVSLTAAQHIVYSDGTNAHTVL